MSGRPGKKGRKWLWLALAVLALAVFMADGQRHLVTDEYTCRVENLPGSFDGYRILQLSDLHGASFGRDNRRLLAAVRRAEPDLIALTGDFVEKEADLEVTAKLLPELAGIAPCYFVSGNHEWASGCVQALEEQLLAAGVTYLHNEYIPLCKEGEEILLCGVEDPNSWADMIRPDELVAELRRSYPETPVVLLGHRNYWVERYPSLEVDLILCGHGHGGIIRLPGIGGLLGTDRLLFPAYAEGAHVSGRYTMVVSRGLGNIRRSLRVFNYPQLVLITLEA